MCSNSRLVSILQRNETYTAEDEQEGSNDGIAGSATATSESELFSDDDEFTTFDVLTEDFLPVIFDNLGILTPKDLLHFRLVNRSWRNAATSVLLKRNVCEIALNFGEVVLNEAGNKVGQARRFHTMEPEHNSLDSYKYFNVYQPTSFLQDLSELISTSSKFPANSICFNSECSLGFGNLCPTNDFSKTIQHKKELFHFFSLYGEQIKKLSLRSCISKKAVQNLLYVHLPHLICLDLQDFERFSDQDLTQEGCQKQVCLPPPSKLKIKVIWIGISESQFNWIKCNFVKELMGAAPSLSDVRNVGVSSLQVLLEMGKFHLVKDFHFDPRDRYNEMSTVEQLTNFLIDTMMKETLPRLKLSNLKVEHIGECSTEYEAFLVKVLNLILSASKNSLKYLDLVMCSSGKFVNLFIPSLPHLKCLTLNDYRSSFATRIHFLGDCIGETIQAGEITADQLIYDFGSDHFANSLIPADYFPCLLTVELQGKEIENNSCKLKKFFSLEHLLPVDKETITVTGDTLLTVTALELTSFPQNGRNLSKLFPNVSRLKIAVSWPSRNLRNWVWCTFPKLERFEIYGLCHEWDTYAVDSFFTGISPELCANIEGDVASTELDELIPSPVMERAQPYIGECENLKEFKINFRYRLNSKFASKVTAAYAFQEVVYRTKIIFSFEGVKMSEKDIEDTSRYLDPVAPYVEFQMK